MSQKEVPATCTDHEFQSMIFKAFDIIWGYLPGDDQEYKGWNLNTGHHNHNLFTSEL